MNKKKNGVLKKIVIIFGCIVAVLAILIGVLYFSMVRTVSKAMKAQVNEDIDMSKVSDGTYAGSSDGGLVKVEVEVTVKDHQITDINLIKHQNAKGKPAEATIDEMLKNNTDNVDAVSGATASSRTIRNAVNVALQQGLQE